MQKHILLTLTLCLLAAPALAQHKTSKAAPTPARQNTTPATAPSPAAPNPIRDADRLFSHGEDAARDRQSLEIVEKAMTADANNYQLLWRLARSCYYVCDEAGSADKLRYFERGIEAGQKAVALQPNSVEGHFWLGVCYGGYSEVKGALKALATVKKIRAEMETVLRLNAGYEEGNAYLALGEMDRELPRLFGGNTSRAISYLEKGLSVAPKSMNIRLSLSQAYLDTGRRDEANRLLQEVIQMQINPARAKEQRSIQEKARKLLNK